MNLVSINANAKVNFSIDVLGFAENGYHLVDMIMQTICVYDRIILYTPEAIPELREDIVSDIMTAKRKHDERIEVLKARGVPIRLPDPSDNIIFTCTNHRLPVDQKNLAYRAALLMKEIAGYKGKLGIHIRKNIPVGGGLGGGSADAAATLVGLNRLFGTELSTEKLMELGATLGSDVPFLVMGGTALATDTGTTLKPLPSLTNGYMLVVNPDIFLSTEKVYTKLDQMRLSPESHPDTQFLIEALMVSLFGCLIGLGFSWIALKIIGVIGDVSYGVDPGVAALAVAFSMGIGVLFGLYPANKAARKKPIDALRAE